MDISEYETENEGIINIPKIGANSLQFFNNTKSDSSLISLKGLSGDLFK